MKGKATKFCTIPAATYQVASHERRITAQLALAFPPHEKYGDHFINGGQAK
jgi:hypothetical protein